MISAELSAKKRIYYQKHRAKILAQRHTFYVKNPNLFKIKNKYWYKNNKNYVADKGKIYYQSNRAKIIQRSIAYEAKRIKIDPQYKLRKRLRARMKLALINGYKKGMAINLLGCSILELKKHLESLFQNGMSWKNYGKWHLDHIKPCSLFDLTKPDEQAQCFHYSNLQPLWAHDNLKKSNTYSM